MHRCESCKGRAGLKQFLDEQLSHIDSESEFHYNQRDTTDWVSLTTVATTCEEYKDVLIDAIDKLTHFSPVPHFYTPWKRQKTFGFLTFSGGLEMWRWTKMG